MHCLCLNEVAWELSYRKFVYLTEEDYYHINTHD
jgi:hypothetical protein